MAPAARAPSERRCITRLRAMSRKSPAASTVAKRASGGDWNRPMHTSKSFVPLVVSLLTISTLAACAGRQKVPVKESLPTVVPTRAEEVVDLLHGVPVKDPYRWLEDEKQPEVQAWVEAQDAATRAWL